MNESEENPKASQSCERFQAARRVIPGGLSRNTVFRDPHPNYADFGVGCRVTDIDGTTRIDMANNMASLIHGHANPAIIHAVTEQLQRGTAFTMATEAELQLAQMLCDRVPWFEKIRFTNSGTEAVMAAIKCARAVTGRPMVAKAEGTYHGTYDYAEVSQNSSPETWGDPTQPASIPVVRGTPESALSDVVVFPFNDIDRTIGLLDRHAHQLACVLIDPVPHRAGLVPGAREYICALGDWCRGNEVLLVFDEVITFRMSYSGAADWYDVQPDLTTLGKIIGGGFPVGALAGKDEYMSVMDPLAESNSSDLGRLPFPFSGTFSANPITMTAGRVAMELFDGAAITHVNRLGDLARQKIAEIIAAKAVPLSVTGAGSMFRIHPHAEPPTEYRSAWQSPEQNQQTRMLVDYMYQNGFMMFRTATAALSTVTTESEITQFADTLAQYVERLNE